jgi:hypothetical protein
VYHAAAVNGKAQRRPRRVHCAPALRVAPPLSHAATNQPTPNQPTTDLPATRVVAFVSICLSIACCSDSRLPPRTRLEKVILLSGARQPILKLEQVNTDAQAAERGRNCPPTKLDSNFLACKCEVFLPPWEGRGGEGRDCIHTFNIFSITSNTKSILESCLFCCVV